MPYKDIPKELNMDVSEYTIGQALKKAGFKRHPACKKLPISEKNRQTRLE